MYEAICRNCRKVFIDDRTQEEVRRDFEKEFPDKDFDKTVKVHICNDCHEYIKGVLEWASR